MLDLAGDGLALRSADGQASFALWGTRPVFASLLAWVDDGDAVSSIDELRPLARTGITSISLVATPSAEADPHGNELGLTASARGKDRLPTPIIDVWFVIGGR